MRLANRSKLLFASTAFAASLAASACQQAADTNNAANSNSVNTNATVNVNSANSANMTTSTVTTNTGQTIEAREPDKYSATVVVNAAATGQQQASGQAQVKVARNGSDRRYSVDTHLPGLGEIIYLEKGDKHYVIFPARKQYAEITQDMTGVNMDAVRSMTPGQIVAFVERQQGVERVGDETLNNRAVTKYRVAGRAQTQSAAGQVQGETYIYVDKETGLPLRVEGFGTSTGNVQGVSGGNLVAEMQDLKTDVDPSQFELPQGYSQITPEQVKQYAAQVAAFAQSVMGFINSQQQQGAAPALTPTPTPAQ
ncbi:MAG TPA: hypothetical protein VLJ61_07950 [Pyrinomonadaceae bacterium]|nr:hypothetical protein [Pyrinomonadaceae bacterium]